MENKELQEWIEIVNRINKEWLTINELEVEFGIMRSTQAKMRMSGKLPYHKIGKTIRYHRPDINKMFLNAKVV